VLVSSYAFTEEGEERRSRADVASDSSESVELNEGERDDVLTIASRSDMRMAVCSEKGSEG
jgi:hypothetical protein